MGSLTRWIHLSCESRVYQSLWDADGYLSTCWSAQSPYGSRLLTNTVWAYVTFKIAAVVHSYFYSQFYLLTWTCICMHAGYVEHTWSLIYTDISSYDACNTYLLPIILNQASSSMLHVSIGWYCRSICGQSDREACQDSLNVFIGHLTGWHEFCCDMTFAPLPFPSPLSKAHGPLQNAKLVKEL